MLNAQCFHSEREPPGIEFVDSEDPIAALGASLVAYQPRACPPRCVGECHVHNLHQFPILRRKAHADKDIGLAGAPILSLLRFDAPGYASG